MPVAGSGWAMLNGWRGGAPYPGNGRLPYSPIWLEQTVKPNGERDGERGHRPANAGAGPAFRRAPMGSFRDRQLDGDDPTPLRSDLRSHAMGDLGSRGGERGHRPADAGTGGPALSRTLGLVSRLPNIWELPKAATSPSRALGETSGAARNKCVG
jgi:hypothetical protein